MIRIQFDAFPNICKLNNNSSHRISSWDKTGRNFDFIQIKSKETIALADIEGPGIIKHFYFTTILPNPLEFRNAVIRMYWDYEKSPSVEVPLGDFFGVSNCRLRLINSLMITIYRGTSGSYGFNNYFPMPFSEHAKIEIENQGPSTLGGYITGFWYHIDYEKFDDELPKDIGYFHAHWNRQNLTEVSERILKKKIKNVQLWTGKNLNGEDNYVILDTEGDGQLAGLLLNIDNLAGGWYGEGDDMIFIDDDTWPPSFHGTGSEEIFGGGASPKHEYSGPYSGFHLIENFDYFGNNGMYRWYIHDPIRFKKRVKWTIEHGHANNFENDYSSVAYWYQKEPHKEFSPFPEAQKRLPRLPVNYQEIWEECVATYTKINAKKQKLKKNFPEKTDRIFQDASHEFMLGKYQKAQATLENVRLNL